MLCVLPFLLRAQALQRAAFPGNQVFEKCLAETLSMGENMLVVRDGEP